MMESLNVSDIMRRAYNKGILIPAFNVAYLPMVKPIVETLVKYQTFGLVEVARLEVEKFKAESFEAVAKEYGFYKNPKFTRLHQDHIPVIDEDGAKVDWKSLIQKGLDARYDSVMIDGSRLAFRENIDVTRQVADMAHEVNKPAEAELGAVMGHEKQLSMSYDEIYERGIGFTSVDEATQFVKETKIDWLSVAIGNIHGAISGAAKDKDKVQARLNIDHLKRLSQTTNVPLVLHGGSGIKTEYVLEAIKNGITKINIGTDIRQSYERAMKAKPRDVENARKQVSEKIRELICDVYHIDGSAYKI
jgi:ketose-bisphosphate aldolase